MDKIEYIIQDNVITPMSSFNYHIDQGHANSGSNCFVTVEGFKTFRARHVGSLS